MRINDGDIFSSSVRGNVRKQNEDSCGVFDVPNGKLFVVCDGMGGHAGGATASKIGVDSISNYFQQTKYPDIKRALADALEYANIQIIETADETPALKGMGTTACVLLINEDEAWIAHCGDSRIYLYCAEQKWLHRVTRDHSYVQGLVDQGIITDAEAENHPNKNRILRALGIKPGCMPTICEAPILPANEDTFLICSDGLSGMVNDEQLQYVLQQDESIANKGQLMIQLALQAGGLDNITTQLIKISNSQYAHSSFVSQNPKERLIAQPLPTSPTNKSSSNSSHKKSSKLFLKIIVPVTSAILLVCGGFGLLHYLQQDHSPRPAAMETVIPYNNNTTFDRNYSQKPAESPVPAATPQTTETLEEGTYNYKIEYWEIDPLTDKKEHYEKTGNYESDIDTSNFFTNSNKNYEYILTIKGTTRKDNRQNVKTLYRQIVNNGKPQLSISEPKVTTPSKSPVKVESFGCDLYGKEKPNTTRVLKDLQWHYIYYENDVIKDQSGYYDSESAVKVEADAQIAKSPDSLLCKVEWFYAAESKGFKTNNYREEPQPQSDLREEEQSDLDVPTLPNPSSSVPKSGKKGSKQTKRTR